MLRLRWWDGLEFGWIDILNLRWNVRMVMLVI